MFSFDFFDFVKAKIVAYSVWKAIIVLSTIPIVHVMAIGFVIFMALLLVRELKK